MLRICTLLGNHPYENHEPGQRLTNHLVAFELA